MSGDLYHYTAESAQQGRVPPREQTLRRRPRRAERIEEFLTRTHSQLWISHSHRAEYRDALKAPGLVQE